MKNTTLSAVFGDRYCEDDLTRTAWASAACLYRHVPSAVVFPKNLEEIRKLFLYATTHNENLTFRAAGTSLSGQAVTDGILVDCSRFWRKTNVIENGQSIWFEPGVVAKQLNIKLKPFGRKIGPDPASIDTCRMGGVLANNASGMCCGVTHNSYHTLQHIHFMLPNGRSYDTSNAGDYDRFCSDEPILSSELEDIRKSIETNGILKARIQKKYRIKNTMGYGLNSFIDFTRPLDIFSHLLIGSEGTLAYIASASLKTIPADPFAVTALLYFETIEKACEAIVFFKTLNPSALELMDNMCLKVIAGSRGVPQDIKQLPDGAAALLIEWGATSLTEQISMYSSIDVKLVELKSLKYHLTINADEQQMLWSVRKGIFPAVGAKRPAGSTVVIEDVCVGQADLTSATIALRHLLADYGYKNSAIFGHANDGNLHFVMSVSLDSSAAKKNYDAFMKALAHLIVDQFEGSLKAEHGTGRNMAPFVKDEWGQDAYEIMKKIKGISDPNNILNRDVLLSNNSSIHIENLKDFPKTNSLIDGCIECGFCEVKCPSHGYTLSPRQRIVVSREITRRQKRQEASELLESFRFSGVETCAADGLCATACPVEIDTGAYIKTVRRGLLTAAQKFMAMLIARYFKYFLVCTRFFGPFVRPYLINAPRFRKHGYVGPSQRKIFEESPTFLYFPSCIVRTFSEIPESAKDTIDEALFKLCDRANVNLVSMKDVDALCCGMPFASKGYEDAQAWKENELVQSICKHQKMGSALKIVIDTSTCSHHIKQLVIKKNLNFEILDLSEFLRDQILSKLSITSKLGTVAIHPGCGAIKASLLPVVKAVAESCASTVYLSPRTGCCGAAGDKGMLIPKLVANALAEQTNDIEAAKPSKCFGTNLICQASLTTHTKQNFLSLVHLVLEATEVR